MVENNTLFVAVIKKALPGKKVVTEHRFHPVRRWRFDIAIPELKIAIEIEGGAWVNGRHTRASGFIKDMEKYNSAVLLGWRLFRYAPGMESDCMRDMEEIGRGM
jgi:very-short-patch-repair endonuclease